MNDQIKIRRATAADAVAHGRILHEFNEEFGSFTPGAEAIAGNSEPLLASGEVVVLFAGDGPDGFAQLRFRPSVLTGKLDAYLEELYVAPPLRGRGIGRALLEAAMDAARAEGAGFMDLGTSEDDKAAMALYESAGFTNREDHPEGPVMYVYEREL